MSQVEGFQLSATGLLVGGLGGTSSGLLQADNSYRRYRSALTIGTYAQGSYSYARRSIFYEVGRRHHRLRDALHYTQDNEDILNLDASFEVNQVQASNFETWARKFGNLAPQWRMMDLAAVVERLAKGVAAQSIFGEVSAEHLRAGQPLRVVALGTLDTPQTASNRSVFIPRTVDCVGADHVFAVLVAASNGEGASVTTDYLRLDPAENQPVVPNVAGASFAQACVEALRVLGANFAESGAGDVFAYALTRGIHHVVSVVSHTDEGGWMRAALRGCGFRVPYGGINPSLRHYPALPPLAATSLAACSAWVDNIALKTAAAVAHADPCVNATGGLYPTVFTAGSGPVGPPGTAQGDCGPEESRSIGRQISGDSGRFCPLYIKGLRAIFGMTSDSGTAVAHMSAAIGQVTYASADRHLQHKTVAPYFWIEPTSLLPARFIDSAAEAAGFASLCTSGEEASIPNFEIVRELDRGHHADYCTIGFKMRTARTSGFVCANAAVPGQLSGIKLYQFDEDSIVLAGDNGHTPGDVPTKHAAADPLASYLWVRGQSALPAPAEFINIQGAYAAKYKIVTWDDDFDATLSDLPEAWELEQHPTRWRVSVPTACQPGPSNWADPVVRRARARAAIALAQATLRARGFGESSSPVITVSNAPPDLGPGPTHPPDLPHVGQTSHNPNPGPTQIFAEGNQPDTEPPIVGAPLPPVPFHQPLRGAPYPRLGGGVVGGGGPAPPPPAPPGPFPPGQAWDPSLAPSSDHVPAEPAVAAAEAAPQA